MTYISEIITRDIELAIWLPVPGLEGVEVSSLGGVRGHTSGTFYTTREGYEKISHKGRAYLVHRLVCEAFSGPAPADKTLVLHWDDDKANNRASNLRWGSHLENSADAKRNEIVCGPRAWRKNTPMQ